MVAILLNWVVRPIVGVLVGQTAIQLSHLFGFYPDRLLAEWVYGLVTQVPSPEIVELFRWGLAAVIGFSLLGAHEFVKSRRKSPAVDVGPESKRDVWLSDAMIYVLRGGWGDRIDPASMSENELGRFYEIEKEFRQASLDGKLPIWGKRVAHGLWEEVLAEDWASYDFDEFDLLKSLAEPEKLIVLRIEGRFSTQEWVRVMTSKAKAEELWPMIKAGTG